VGSIQRTVLATVLLAMTGCNSIWNGWLDPSQVGRFRGKPLTREIRRSVSVADEPAMELQATEPTPEDLEVKARDYVLRPSDVVDISINEFFGAGWWTQRRQISREGYISLPQVSRRILAAGKTGYELQKHIEKVLQEEQIVTEPMVIVVVSQARYTTYNIVGAIGGPGSRIIPRPDFRLVDALAASGWIRPTGGPKQPLVRTIYVFRAPSDQTVGPKELPTTKPVEPMTFGTVQQGTGDDPGGHWIYVDDEWKFVKEPKAGPGPTTTAGTQPVVTTQPTRPVEVKEEEKWEALAAELPTRRVLAIPIEKLEQGDPRYNVVIRDGDTIWVPPPVQGEFYMMGNVPRPGVYSLTGREITLRQAISAAGGLGALADPSRCELVRRIGPDQEQILQINIDRIFAGKEDDIILKPNDIINVGTNPLMRFLAVVRNAFRATYGFGFVYDRNFADIDSFNSRTNPETRRRSERQQRFGF